MGRGELLGYVADIAATLVRINTENPPGRELQAASYFAERAAELGLRTVVERLGAERGSVVATLETGREGPTLMLNSHLDTVPAGDLDAWAINPFYGEIRGDVLYGLGAADAKGCLAAMLGAVKLLLDEGRQLSGRLILAAVADEEVNGLGTVHLLKKGYRAEYVVVGEPTGLNVCLGNRGRGEFVVTVRGRSAHASSPALGVNAIGVAAELVRRFKRLEKGYGRRHPELGRCSASVTMISGGVKPNVIPDNCSITLDWRTTPHEDIEDVKRRIAAISSSVVRKHRGATFSVKTVSYAPPVATPRRSRVVKAALNALRRVGRRPRLTAFTATTDLSRIAQHGSVEGVILGPGSLAVIHSPREHVRLEELAEAAQVYANIIEELLSKT